MRGARGPVKMAGSDSNTIDHRSTPTLTSLWTIGAITSAPACTTSNESEGGAALPSGSVTASAFISGESGSVASVSGDRRSSSLASDSDSDQGNSG